MSFHFLGGRYSLGGEAGRGAHCIVWQCHRIQGTGVPAVFALKVHNGSGASAALKREASALKALSATQAGAGLFPMLLGTIRLHGRSGLAMPVHGIDLYQLQKMHDRKPFPSSFVWSVAAQLLSGLVALEQVQIVHVRN
jgi:hypothetical protein